MRTSAKDFLERKKSDACRHVLAVTLEEKRDVSRRVEEIKPASINVTSIVLMPPLPAHRPRAALPMRHHLPLPLSRNAVGTLLNAAAPAIFREAGHVKPSKHVMERPARSRVHVIVRMVVTQHRMGHAVDALQQILSLFHRRDGVGSLRVSFSGL